MRLNFVKRRRQNTRRRQRSSKTDCGSDKNQATGLADNLSQNIFKIVRLGPSEMLISFVRCSTAKDMTP